MEPRAIFKLRIRIADREFEAEATRDVIDEWLAGFRAMAAAGQDGRVRSTPEAGTPPRNEPLVAAQAGAKNELEALFESDADGEVRGLQVMPSGPHRVGDAILLILLAHKRLRGREQVPVIVLKQALRRSGAPVERLDRALAHYLRAQVVLKSGSGKGGRYRLSQEGLRRAESLSQELRRLVTSS